MIYHQCTSFNWLHHGFKGISALLAIKWVISVLLLPKKETMRLKWARGVGAPFVNMKSLKGGEVNESIPGGWPNDCDERWARMAAHLTVTQRRFRSPPRELANSWLRSLFMRVRRGLAHVPHFFSFSPPTPPPPPVLKPPPRISPLGQTRWTRWWCRLTEVHPCALERWVLHHLWDQLRWI